MSHQGKIEAETENRELIFVNLLSGYIFKLAIGKMIKLAGILQCDGGEQVWQIIVILILFSLWWARRMGGWGRGREAALSSWCLGLSRPECCGFAEILKSRLLGLCAKTTRELGLHDVEEYLLESCVCRPPETPRDLPNAVAPVHLHPKRTGPGLGTSLVSLTPFLAAWTGLPWLPRGCQSRIV